MAAPSTEFASHETSIPGLVVFDVSRIDDSRGGFQEKFHKEKLVQSGLPESFNVVQTSVSFNVTGTTRGLHAEPWDKYVSLVDGTAFAAYVDLREGDTYGTIAEVELRSDIAVFIPAGVANSFQCLTPVYYLYNVNQHWTPDAYERYSFFNLADPDLAIEWPIPLSDAVLSERDVAHPLLRDTQPIAG